MTSDRVLAYGLWLGIVALTIVAFRVASCQEMVAGYETRALTCQCLEPDRVSVTVEPKHETK